MKAKNEDEEKSGEEEMLKTKGKEEDHVHKI